VWENNEMPGASMVIEFRESGVLGLGVVLMLSSSLSLVSRLFLS